MESLPDVWLKVKSIAEKLDKIHTREITHKDLTDISDDLNKCAEAVQSIRDQLDFE